MSLANPTLEDVWKLFQESDKKWQEMRTEMRQASLETDRKFQETDKKIKEVSTNIDRLGNKLGDFVEEMVYPAAVRLFKDRGINAYQVYRNITAACDGEGIEIDLLVDSNTDVIAIECKSTLSIDDVNEHLERLEKLKRLLPAHANKQVMGAVSGMVTPDNVARYAYKKGLFVIGQTGEQLMIQNDLKFNPKIW